MASLSGAPASVEVPPEWWHRVGGLRPQLPERVDVHRHRYRGQRWHVLRDASSGRHYRVDPTGWEVVARLDGRRTLEEVWQAVATRCGAGAPSRVELLALVARLRAASLVACELPAAAEEIFERFAPSSRVDFALPRWVSPLYVRLPLFDPDRWFARAVPYARPLFGRVGLAVWSVVVGCAALLAGAHWSELSHGGLARVLDPDHLILLVVLYPLVKACHEAGHALATRVWGGEVHELGVVFLVFMPLPYVDASAATAFPDKRRRIAVGAAGMMVELGLSSLALFVWLLVEPGTVRNAAWLVMVIGGVSTVLFNGNPLLRYDGYYVLADWVEIPNLRARAYQYWARGFERLVLGLPEQRASRSSRSERAWFAGFGAASLAYRVSVVFGIAVFVAGRFVLLGAVFLLGGLALQLLLPAVRALRRLRVDPRVRAHPRRALWGAASAASAAVLLLGVLPLPSHTFSEGVVWLPERAEVRASHDGFVRRVRVQPGAWVEPGDALVDTVDVARRTQRRVLEARLREMQARHAAERGRDRVKAALLEDDIDRVRAELSRVRTQIAEATIRAASAGRLVLPDAVDLPDRFVRRGDLLGYVADLRAPVVRAVVDQDEVLRVRERIRGVEVRLTDGRVVTGRIQREVPTVDTHLPSLALGSAGGGRIAVDVRDKRGLTAAEPVYQLDVALPKDAPVSGIGAPVRLRFEYPPEPLGRRALRALWKLFLGKLEA